MFSAFSDILLSIHMKISTHQFLTTSSCYQGAYDNHDHFQFSQISHISLPKSNVASMHQKLFTQALQHDINLAEMKLLQLNIQ